MKLSKLFKNPLLTKVLNTLAEESRLKFVVVDKFQKNLFGTVSKHYVEQHPIFIENKNIGWVYGDHGSEKALDIISMVARLEYEKRSLIKETLSKYKEINFLYNIIEKLSNCPRQEEVIQLLITEVENLFPSTSVCVLAYQESSQDFEIFTSSKKLYYSEIPLKPGVGIAGYVFLSGKPEVVNDVSQDSRYIPDCNDTKALMCAPLKTKEKTLGVLRVCSDESVQYSANDLKLLNAISTQAGNAIESAILKLHHHQQVSNNQGVNKHESTNNSNC